MDFVYHSTYRGTSIYRGRRFGYALRWKTYRFSADTLAGLKRLIREMN